jgi:predicted RNA-binding protein with PIN domain
MAEPTLYLFDGYNLLHAGAYADRRELTDALASFVAVRGARGILVWDGGGDDAEVGPLSVRHAPNADALLERLAAEHRLRETVLLVSSDAAVRGTSGQEVQKRSSASFAAELGPPTTPAEPPARLADALDAETRARLEQLRRGR